MASGYASGPGGDHRARARGARSSAAACCSGTPEVVEEAVRAAQPPARAPTAYLVDPADHFAAIRRARTEGRSVVGDVPLASATRPAVPSTDRLREAQLPRIRVPDCVARANPRTPDVRGYRLRARQFVEVGLVDVMPSGAKTTGYRASSRMPGRIFTSVAAVADHLVLLFQAELHAVIARPY